MLAKCQLHPLCFLLEQLCTVLKKNCRFAKMPGLSIILVIFFSGGFTIAALALAAVRPVFEPIFLITKLASFFPAKL
jgi:hypothetical protein